MFASNSAGIYKVYAPKPDGADVTLVADTAGRATAPQWTADGRHILFPVCQRGGPENGCRILVSSDPTATEEAR